MLLRGIFRTADDHGEKRISNVGHNHANRLGFLLDQTAGDEVGTVVQFTNCFIHALSAGFAHMSFVVDDGGNGKN